jgi:hypothetical protein
MMATGSCYSYTEREVLFAIHTEVSQMVRQFFPETLVGFSDISRQDDGIWTVSLYMPETMVRDTYALGLLFSDPAHAFDS